MNWTEISVQLIKSLSGPVTALIVLFWFQNPIKKVLVALAFLIRKRRFKGRFGRATVEVGGAVREEVQALQRAIAAVPLPPIQSSEVPDVIEARRFILRDEAGRARAEIGFRNDSPLIRLFDAKGSVTMTLGDNLVEVESPNGSASIILFADDRTPSVHILGHEATGYLDTQQLSLSSGNGSIRLGSGAHDEPPRLILSDILGETLALP